MKQLLNKLAKLITGEGLVKPAQVKKLTTRDLIRMESEIGAQLFGPIPKGHRREFFCLDEHTWIWHEEWVDPKTKKYVLDTTRYEIRGDSIVKVQDAQPYKKLEGQELRNLVIAMQLYYEQVVRGIYHYDPKTGHPLPSHPGLKKAE